jgi:hypothetical protein
MSLDTVATSAVIGGFREGITTELFRIVLESSGRPMPLEERPAQFAMSNLARRPRDSAKHDKRRVLLDTNVWRYVSDENAADDLLRAALRAKLQILIAPSVVYEALRTANADLRRRQLSLMTSDKWKRLMPEAYSESQELLVEIRRLRPHWLRETSDLTSFRRLRWDWMRKKNGFWDRARYTPEREAQYLAQLGHNNMVETARLEAKGRREDFSSGSLFETAALNTLRVRLAEPWPGWNGDPIDPWRVHGWTATTSALSSSGNHPYRDWLSSEVDLSRTTADPASWLQFWFYDVEAKNMPRFWLRWAFEHLQGFRKVTDGTPCDAQLATYLPEADLAISADKAFISIANRCCPFAPCRLAHAELIPGGKEGVQSLLKLLNSPLRRLTGLPGSS